MCGLFSWYIGMMLYGTVINLFLERIRPSAPRHGYGMGALFSEDYYLFCVWGKKVTDSQPNKGVIWCILHTRWESQFLPSDT